jgi:hypothetical protein
MALNGTIDRLMNTLNLVPFVTVLTFDILTFDTMCISPVS